MNFNLYIDKISLLFISAITAIQRRGHRGLELNLSRTPVVQFAQNCLYFRGVEIGENPTVPVLQRLVNPRSPLLYCWPFRCSLNI